jgi:hypothetical protein
MFVDLSARTSDYALNLYEHWTTGYLAKYHITMACLGSTSI